MKIWISGYSRKDHPSMALYDPASSAPLWAADPGNPSWLCFHGPYVFAVGEFDDHGTLTSFLREGNRLRLIDTTDTEGGALCHITTDASMEFLSGSCWGTGHFFTVQLHADGTFGPVLFSQVLDDGTGRKSRMHFSSILGDFIYAVNIELDALFCFRQEKGRLTPVSLLRLPKGCGPRHFYADQKRRRFYCVTEYSSQLLVIDSTRPEKPELLGQYPLLDPAFAGESTGSTLAVSRDGRDLYAANRGEDTIVHFTLSPEGIPSLAGRYSCHGKCPRHIALMDQDGVLGIANQRSDEVILLERDFDTGRLGRKPLQRISFASPSFVAEDSFSH